MAKSGVRSKSRILKLLGIFSFALAMLLIFRVGYWMLFKAEWLQEKATSQWTRERPVSAERGDIIDRNGTVLASSATCDSVLLNPKVVRKNAPQQTAQQLSDILGMELDDVNKLISSDKTYDVWVKRQITTEQAQQIQALKAVTDEKGKSINLIGVTITEDTKRYYPMGNFLSQVLGYTTIDGTGQAGVESTFDKYLAGTNGYIKVETDGRGNELPDSVQEYMDPEQGLTVQLTIDAAIQSFVTQAMDRCVQEQGPTSALCLVMDPNTGELLGNYNYPNFDNNNPPRSDLEELNKVTRNPSISDVYEPGSTYKILTMASALDSGAISTNSTFYCPGYRIVAGQKIRCWTRNSHGSQTLAEAVQHSCNPAFMDMALNMGTDTFYEYLYNFGLGSKTGIALSGEATGIMTSPKYVQEGDLARIGFGQSIAVTPIQLITAASAAINGGNLMKPLIASRVVNKDGQAVTTFEPEVVRQVISAENSAIVRDLLVGVVEKGSGKNGAVAGYKVGGKTGTAQKYDENGKIQSDKHISSFLSFAPADNPQFIVLVVVNEPTSGLMYGSVVAAPYAKEIMENCLKYASIAPTEPVEDPNQTQETVETPACTDMELETALSKLQAAGLNYLVEGYGGKVVAQMPAAGATVNKGSTVQLFLEQVDDSSTDGLVEVPDLSGKPATEVNNTLRALGLQLEITGTSGVAVSQSPAAGEKVQPGETVTVEFQPPPGGLGATPTPSPTG